MMVMLGVLVAASLLEIILAYSLPPKPVRVPLAVVFAVVALAAATGLLWQRWPVWLGVWVFQLYRSFNQARLIKNHLPASELKRLVPRTFWWLVGFQMITGCVSWLFAEQQQLRHAGLLIAVGVPLVLAIILLRSTLRTWRRTQLPRHIEPRSDNELPSISVLIPARNETDDLDACLTTLVASDYPKMEIIVYDDRSVTRKTPEILRMFAHDGVRFINGQEPDTANWLAKNQAYSWLRREASGEILVFCGVDVRFERQTLRRLVETLLGRKKQMLSLLPLRAAEAQSSASLIQPMRYFWELALPRRRFNRPPVLSTCWLVRASALEKLGGFAAVARKIVPEAFFARMLAKDDGYSFVRSNASLGLSSVKKPVEQHNTAIRTRYPQTHRRVELVVLVSLLELFVLVWPFVGLFVAWVSPFRLYVFGVSLLSCLLLLVVYYRVAVATKLNSRWLAWFLLPFAALGDIVLLHISMCQYEFATVTWKDRNISAPVMRGQERVS